MFLSKGQNRERCMNVRKPSSSRSQIATLGRVNNRHGTVRVPSIGDKDSGGDCPITRFRPRDCTRRVLHATRFRRFRERGTGKSGATRDVTKRWKKSADREARSWTTRRFRRFRGNVAPRQIARSSANSCSAGSREDDYCEPYAGKLKGRRAHTRVLRKIARRRHALRLGSGFASRRRGMRRH